MANTTGKRNVRSNKHSVTTSYTEITFFASMQNLVGLFVPSDGAFLSVGYDVPTDGTSIDIPAGTAWEIPMGVTGKVFIKSKTAGFTASLYGA